jgi:hypothetical protein
LATVACHAEATEHHAVILVTPAQHQQADADAQAVAAQCELAHLRAHRSFRDSLRHGGRARIAEVALAGLVFGGPRRGKHFDYGAIVAASTAQIGTLSNDIRS